ncbi:hypothetical protein BZG35_01485 [Brevundimonas sp. LM2]|uniref:hypothetical protein n=1 Tax=Brevundimonas sp. LM2 TaxID=1938605 RepID=UPI000983C05E|nr:hypothetical protein [Brevundimonas sp. LM2]AQR60473.1 hypothetical protein BZG35_01485 [Brevundimonas sp. LM2]
MTDTPETASEALKRVLAAKKAGAGTSAHAGMANGKADERAVAAKSAALAKPAFRKASKRG